VTSEHRATRDSRLATSTALTDAQRRVDAWIGQFEEGYFHPLTNLARLTEEVGELAREVNHRFGEKTKKRDEPEGDLAMEMADILFVLICMANREGIDLQEAFDRMMGKVEFRDQDRWTKKKRERD
jgi:NTP pyrophosphatase (non-canonical NTP hydrolase)